MHVNGSRKRDYFATIWKNFTDIHHSFANLDYEEKIPLPGHPKHYVTYKNLIGHEKNGWTTYRSGELGIEFSVKELLDGVEDEKTRMERYERQGWNINYNDNRTYTKTNVHVDNKGKIEKANIGSGGQDMKGDVNSHNTTPEINIAIDQQQTQQQ